MPSAPEGPERWGRAVGRERLDQALLQRAAALGAIVLQPWAVERIATVDGDYRCTLVARGRARGGGASILELSAPIVIAAHGSWEHGDLPTQPARQPSRPRDLIAFKALFRHASLPAALMPLLVFPGGYGGMVETDDGRVSVSCCIRRDVLERCRRDHRHGHRGMRAGEVVCAHLRASCRGAEEVLDGASLDGAWLSAGPIRPGMRASPCPGIFAIGNAAGEAHPLIAEGISMALQSAWLLAALLAHEPPRSWKGAALASVHRAYARAWHRNFALRLRASTLFAALATRAPARAALVAGIRCMPGLLTLGAAWGGKARVPHPAERIVAG
jgi:flavin-dependent dehydrogenase